MKILRAFLLGFIVAGCAPGLGSSLQVDYEEDPDVTPLKATVAGTETNVHVLKFSDIRPIEAVAQVDGRVIKPSTDLGIVVQRAFEAALRKNDVKLALFEAPTVRGEIKEWHVAVTPSFPTTSLEANCSLIIELLDVNNHRIHRTQYSGSFNQEHPFMGESDVQSALAKALGIAIHEALSDPVLINKIATSAGSGRALPDHLQR